jgi:DNA-3-methyladenine glycosylase II
LPILCDALAKKFSYFKYVISLYGYPPFFERPNNFASLVQIILEQQVSLASARATYNKLKQTVNVVTPIAILNTPIETIKACGVTKQKTSYLINLANAIQNKDLVLKDLPQCSNQTIIAKLTNIKGIGSWTAQVYLIMILHRQNIFSLGDIALVNSCKQLLQLPKQTTKAEIEAITKQWQPYKTIAAFLLWWFYINERKITWQ